MEWAREGNKMVARLHDGDDLFSSVGKIIIEAELTSGLILSGIGMMREFELGYFNGKEYETQTFSEPHELLSLQGSFTTANETIIHMHAALAAGDHSVKGGHLIKGTTNVLNEISISTIENITMRREFNEATGLKELRVG